MFYESSHPFVRKNPSIDTDYIRRNLSINRCPHTRIATVNEGLRCVECGKEWMPMTWLESESPENQNTPAPNK